MGGRPGGFRHIRQTAAKRVCSRPLVRKIREKFTVVWFGNSANLGPTARAVHPLGRSTGRNLRRGDASVPCWNPVESRLIPVVKKKSLGSEALRWPRFSANWATAMRTVKEPLKGKDYEAALRELQIDLCALQEWVKHKGLRVVVLFEGRDAAGKGGTIKAITERVSPRVFRVVALPARAPCSAFRRSRFRRSRTAGFRSGSRSEIAGTPSME